MRRGRGLCRLIMNSFVISTAVLPGVVALLLFLVFTYLHEQSRQPYFRAWQFAWAAYTLHFLVCARWQGVATQLPAADGVVAAGR